ncbi:hypothetical protein F4802DRAFT_587818 [Xylaria palmicola]|nr:hypothetical protein F4802DRAFT_587818 [Xylaria palmicola]
MAHQYIHFFIHYLQLLVWNYNLAMARLLNMLRSPRPIKPMNRREITYFIPMAGGDDERPESSPFESASTEVYFGSGPKFIVPSSLFLDCPRLRQGSKWPPRSVCLDDVTSAVGHVIFYYLLTDTYQCLKPKGHSHHERLVSELATSVGAYNASRKYELLPLQEIAKDEIQRLAQQLPFPLVLNLLRDLHLDPSASETWLDDYVQAGLKNLFRTPTAFLDYTMLQVEEDVISFSNILLKNLAHLLTGEEAPARPDYVNTPTLSPEPVVIEEDEEPRSDSDRISEVAPLPGPSEPAPSEGEPEETVIPVEAVPEPSPDCPPIEEPQHEVVPVDDEPSSPTDWRHFMKTSISKPLWPEEGEDVRPASAEPPLPHVDPFGQYEAAGREYLEEAPASPPEVVATEWVPRYLDPESEPEPVAAQPAYDEPMPRPTRKLSKKDKKIGLSIFRSDEEPKPELVLEGNGEAEAVATLGPLSPELSSSKKAKKKKKKVSLFRTEEEKSP